MSTQALLAKVSTEILPKRLKDIKENKAIADQHGLSLIAYEGGQHFVGIQGGENDSAINAKFDAINRHPEMKQLYTKYLQGWKNAGGEMFAHFVSCSHWSKWGRWGALEYQNQPRSKSPKFDALQQFIEKNPRWW